jgi:hypothetical protein
MRIVLLIAELVVPAVLGYPADGRHLERQTGRYGHGDLEIDSSELLPRPFGLIEESF